MRGQRNLALASLAALVCGLVAVAVPVEAIRVVAALPLALLLPGYAIVALAFGSHRLETPMLLVVSLGTSLSVLALSGVLLDLLPGGIETLTWALLLVAVVLVCSFAAARRRDWAPPSRPLRLPRLGGRDTVLLVAAAVIAVGAFVLAQTPLPATHATGFTALWMLPSEPAEDSVEVGVQSSEQESEEYVLRVVVGAEAPQVTRFSLEPGQEQTLSVAVAPPVPGGSTEVTASLYKAGEPGQVYRRVVSWLPRKENLP